MLSILFWISIFSGGFLIVLLLLSLVGGLDFDLDLDFSGDSDTDAGGLGLMKAILVFLSIGSWMTRALMINDKSNLFSISIGVVCGIVAVYILSKVLGFLLTQTEDNTWDIKDTINQEGKVYLKIPNSGTGIVQVQIHGVTHEFKASSEGEVEIPTGSLVEVLDVSKNELIVKPA